VLSPEAAADEANAFMAEEALCEARIARADVGEAVHSPSAAEELAFEAVAPRAAGMSRLMLKSGNRRRWHERYAAFAV